MKFIKFVILVAPILGLFTISTYSQESKRNNNWVTGFGPSVKMSINYNPSYQAFSSIYNTHCSSTISDTLGDYQFYCTGFYVMDKLGEIMQDGAQVNCPYGTELSNYYGGSSLFTQTSIILPKKGNTYYVFSTGMSDSSANIYLNHIDTKFDVLNYSIVDMDSNAGKGKVTAKNKILMDHQEYANCALTAVKHGNGKDWWLVKADCINNRYQLFLVEEDTILGPYYQYRTDTADSYCYFWGQLYFSHDGSKMVSGVYGNRYNTSSNPNPFPTGYGYQDISSGDTYLPNRVDLYEFDRCNGTLTYKNHYMVPLDTFSYPNYDIKNGLCFSPNDSLLYMSNLYSIYQIDLYDTNVTNGLFITGPDTVITKFPWYYEMAVAPNGKLYIGNESAIRHYMSYIDNPNIKGIGCTFIPNGVWQPYTNLKSIPNMANYGLGAAPVGGNCWPLGMSPVLEEERGISVYPNPASNKIEIQYMLEEHEQADLIFYDVLGNKVKVIILHGNEYTKTIDVSNFASGLYVYHFNTTKGKRYVGKLIIE